MFCKHHVHYHCLIQKIEQRNQGIFCFLSPKKLSDLAASREVFYYLCTLETKRRKDKE